jgi:hypothetical protein
MHIYYTTLQTMQFNHPVCETRRILIFINYSQDKDIRMKMTKIYIHVRRQWKIKTLSKIQNICNSFIFLYIYIFFFAILIGITVLWLQTCTPSTQFAVIICIRLHTNSLMMASYSPKHAGGTHLLTYFIYLLTYLLTHSMQQSPSWETNWFSASQRIPRNLWNPKVYYRIHTCPPPVPILSHIN